MRLNLRLLPVLVSGVLVAACPGGDWETVDLENDVTSVVVSSNAGGVQIDDNSSPGTARVRWEGGTGVTSAGTSGGGLVISVNADDLADPIDVVIEVPAGLDVDVQVGGGDVALSLDVAADGDVAVQSGQGDITLVASPELAADVVLTGADGVSVEDFPFNGTNDGTSAAGAIGGGGASVFLQATSGAVVLRAR